jgi:cytochrome c biogenesis protein CcmG, thiol:disulfide interchange protein DsbE
MSRYILPAVGVLVLIPFLIIGLNKDPSRIPSPFIGKSAPSFDLPSLTDPQQRVGSASYAGQMVLVNIWATWCVGCRQEHEFLNWLSTQDIIPIYGINWRDNRGDALQWLQQLGDPYVASGYDEDARIGIEWGAYGAPETFLVSADGIVLYKHLGPLNPEIWDNLFMPLISAEIAKK